MENYLGLKDKVALVTGGSSGIGLATAAAFAECGAKVVIASRDPIKGEAAAADIRKTGTDCRFIRADIAKPVDIPNMVDETLKVFGRLDYAVNNAGAEGGQKLLVDWTEDDYEQIINTNLRGTWLCMKYQIPVMLRQGGGSIVNVSSCAGLVGFPKHALYSASKAGIQALTKAASSENVKQGVRVNTVCPGITDTPLQREAMKIPEMLAAALAVSPIGRFGSAAETAAAILWLCSERSSFVSGTTMAVDGGWTQH